jgi:hypothetical protein
LVEKHFARPIGQVKAAVSNPAKHLILSIFLTTQCGSDPSDRFSPKTLISPKPPKGRGNKLGNC